MKVKLFLVSFGVAIGALLIGVVYLINPNIFIRLAVGKGSSFESIDDLRASLNVHDSRDQLSDGSVSLRALVRANPSDQIIYELKPNQTARFQHVPVTINSFGMRDRELTKEKPAGVYRIAVLGDSYTFGWGVDQEKIFARWMESELTKMAPPGVHPQVLNFGVPGYATFQEVAKFQESGASFSPDAVLVYIVDNDFGLPFFIQDLADPSALRSAAEFERKKPKPEEVEKLARRKKLLDSLDSNRALLTLARDCEARGIPLFVTFHPSKSALKMRGRMWAMQKSPGKDLIKLLWIMQDYKRLKESGEVSAESLRLPNDNHPGPGAHQLIGKVLAKKFAARVWGIGKKKALSQAEKKKKKIRLK